MQGWNINSEFNEVDIIESQCCISEKQAEKVLENMKMEYKREEWGKCKYKLGEKLQQEGFCRWENGDWIN